MVRIIWSVNNQGGHYVLKRSALYAGDWRPEPDTFAVVHFRLIQNQSYPFWWVWMLPATLLCRRRRCCWREGDADHLAGRHPAALCHRRVAGFGMQENNGWQMRYHLRISRRYGGAGCGRTSVSSSSRIPDDIGHVTERERRHGVDTAVYEDHPAREFCVQYGESDLAFWRGCGRRREFSSLSGLRRTSGAEADAVRRCGGAVTGGRVPFNPDTSAGAETECVSMFRMRRMSARRRCRARITRLRCRLAGDVWAAGWEPERTAGAV